MGKIIQKKDSTRSGGFYCITFCLLGMMILATGTGCTKKAPEHAFPPATVLAAKATQKNMPLTISAIGTVEAFKSVPIYSLVGGRLLQIHFKEGQDVRQRQLLFTIDPAPYRERLRQAEGRLAKDTALMKFNDAEAKRYAFLYEKGAVSKSEADKYRTDADTYEATVQSDKADVEEARLNLEYCSIRAPFDGRTGTYSANIGATVKASDTALATLNQVTPVSVKFSIPEKHIADVKKYMQAGTVQVHVSSSADFDGEIRSGKLSFIDNTVDVNTGMIQLKAEFPNKDKFLWPGQFVNVSLQLTVQRDAVVIPLRAVQSGETGFFIFVVKPDLTADLRPVVVERSIGEETIVSKGVTAGETVITDGHLKVRPGGKVEIKDNLKAVVPPNAPNGTPGRGEKK